MSKNDNKGCLGAVIIAVALGLFWTFVVYQLPSIGRVSAKNYDTVATEFKADIANLEGQFQAFNQRKVNFENVDRGMAKAKAMNAEMIADCQGILESWDKKVMHSLGSHKRALELRAVRFKELAAQWYQKADEAKSDTFRRNYLDNAKTCELLATQSEIRFQQIYGAPVGQKSQADVLKERVEFVRSLRTVHLDWKTTLDEWPSTFDEAGIQSYFEAIGDHFKKMENFEGLMKGLIKTLEEENANSGGATPEGKQVFPNPVSFRLNKTYTLPLFWESPSHETI